MFSGNFTYQVGYGPYMESRSGEWTFLDVPELAACRDTAQAVRRNAGAESAQMYTRDEEGRRVHWYFKIDMIKGGGIGSSSETPREAKARLERELADPEVGHIELTKHTEGCDFITRVGWRRGKDGEWEK